MVDFSVNPQRFDPYKNFKFRVKRDGRYVAGVPKIGALTPTTGKRSPPPCENRRAGRSTSRSPWNGASPMTPSLSNG